MLHEFGHAVYDVYQSTFRERSHAHILYRSYRHDASGALLHSGLQTLLEFK